MFKGPLVNVFKLGRVPYIEALNIQKVLFNKLKNDKAIEWQLEHNGKFQNNNTIDDINTNNNRHHQHRQNNHINYNNHTSFSTSEQITNKDNSICKSFDNQLFKNPKHPLLNHHLTHPLPERNINNLNGERWKDINNCLLLVEHEPVYTIGIRTKLYDNNYVERLKDDLAKQNLEANFIETDRGGLITFHGPGQLVAYPILYLGDFIGPLGGTKSLKAYIGLLERCIIDTLHKIGLSGGHTIREYPGVWIDGGRRKIAFIGISCKRYITMHGISINCDCNLSWFDHIISCGIEDTQITSIQRELSLNYCIDNDEQSIDQSNESFSSPLISNVAQEFCSSFSNYFQCNLINNNTIEE